MATLTFKNINKVYDNNVQAVFDFNLDVKDREFIVFVGPSGCGKSTTLRMVAGLEEISSGELYIGYDSVLVDEHFDEKYKERVAYCYQVKADEKGLTSGEDLVPYKKAQEPIVFINDRSEITYELKAQYSRSYFNRLVLNLEYEVENDMFINLSVCDNPLFNTENKTTITVALKKGQNNESIDLNEFIAGKKFSNLFVKLVWPYAKGNQLHLKSLKIEDNEQRLINSVEPKDRDIAMVFQSYALYPHMTVYNNIAFGLRLRHVSKEIIDQRVVEVAETLGLTPYLKRKPSALSGGQRQRVALGRAIVRSPKVFLMDEPLSNLDAKLRVTMRSEIAKIHEKVGATTIYVTHDQTEAMTMASRIVVMKDGFIQQIGTPREVYSYPENVFVGSFIGSPAMNFIECEMDFEKGVVTVNSQGEVVYAFKPLPNQLNGVKEYFLSKPKEIQDDINTLDGLISEEKNEKILNLMRNDLNEFNKELAYYNQFMRSGKVSLLLGVRPENIYLKNDPRNTQRSEPFDVEADVTELLGHEFIVYGYLGDSRIVIKLGGGVDIKQHTVSTYSFGLDSIHFFDPHSSKRIKIEKNVSEVEIKEQKPITQPVEQKSVEQQKEQKVSKPQQTSPVIGKQKAEQPVKKVYHISKRASDNKWVIKYAGGEKVIKTFATKAEAAEYANALSKNQDGIVLAHASKGKNVGKINKKISK